MVIVHAFYKALPVPRRRLGDPRHRTTTRTCGAWAASASSCRSPRSTFIVGWLAIAGVPPFAGFWAKDEILAEAFFERRLRRSGSSALVAAVLTAFYMTRADLPTFYGNERFRAALGRPTPVVSGGGDDEPVVDRDADADDHDDATASPTVDYGDAGRRRRAVTHDPHEAPWIMVVPARGARGPRRASAGSSTCRSPSIEFLDRVARAGVPRRPEARARRRSCQGFGARRCVAVADRARRHRPRATRCTGAASTTPAVDPLDERLGPLAPVLGNAYYFDDGHRAARRRPGPARRAGWLDRVVDHEDHRRRGQRRRRARSGGRAAALRKLQTGLVRQLRARHRRSARSRSCSTSSLWAGR